jgi:hypothetical protein
VSNLWNSDHAFGFSGPSAGAGGAVATAPGLPAVSNTQPSSSANGGSALKAITDPKGSAIFWITAAAIIGLGLVSGEFAIKERLRVGKRR